MAFSQTAMLELSSDAAIDPIHINSSDRLGTHPSLHNPADTHTDTRIGRLTEELLPNVISTNTA